MTAPTSMEDQFDVVILGAGPAGSAAAWRLASEGSRVLLVRPRYKRNGPTSETVPAELVTLLTNAGLSTAFSDERRSPGIVSAWGSDVVVRDHILSPHGEGYHVSRSEFDQALVEAACNAGTTLQTGLAHVRPRVRANEEFEIMFNERKPVRSRYLLLAGGRTSTGAGLASRRVWLDKLMGVAGTVSSTEESRLDDRIYIQSIPTGWVYSAPLPSGKRVVVVLADSPTIPTARLARRDWWLAAVTQAGCIFTHLLPERTTAPITTHDARSSFLLPLDGRNWLPIGDARLAVDPLSGSGLMRAIEDGFWAASIVASGRSFRSSDIVAERSKPDLVEYIAYRAHYYGLEPRWAEQPFWARRRMS